MAQADTNDAGELEAGLGHLVVRSVAKSYRRRTVVHDVSLSLSRGEAVACSGRTAPARPPCST